MRRVLFVHDDTRMIDHVPRQLAQREPAWEVRVARDENEALKTLNAWNADAVVVAARPPELDGVRLLTRVRDARPEVVRIVLGVDPDAEKGLRALRIAHRALLEPLDPTALHEMLRRMFLLSELVSQPPVKALLGRIGSLPAVPSVYTKLSERLQDPNVSVFELGHMVAGDITLAAQVLRIANSAFFGQQNHVTQLEAAAARLGTRLLRSLVLMAEVYGRFPVSPFMAERLETMQAHASLVARIAGQLEPGVPWRDDAFAAGLLHDIGKLVMATHLPEVHASIVRESERTGRPEYEIELQRLGSHHGTLGACLLGMWGLPSVILESAHLHHEPLTHLPQPLTPALTVALANRLAHSATEPNRGADFLRSWPEVVLIDPRWPAWRDMALDVAAGDLAA